MNKKFCISISDHIWHCDMFNISILTANEGFVISVNQQVSLLCLFNMEYVLFLPRTQMCDVTLYHPCALSEKKLTC